MYEGLFMVFKTRDQGGLGVEKLFCGEYVKYFGLSTSDHSNSALANLFANLAMCLRF